MKCTRCGAEVEAQKFCIYCGERLQPKEVLSVQKRNVKAPSGVMRYRHRSSISNTALPEIQKKQPETAKMQLASLNGSQQNANATVRTYTGQNRFDMDVREHSAAQIGASRPSIARPQSGVRTCTGQNRFEPEIQEQASRQSRELELLLQKLNGSETSLTMSCEDEDYEDDLLSEDASLKSMASLDVDLDADESLDGFFIGDEDAEMRDVSGTAPMGSGNFARVPSGGFHLVVDSIKSACKGIVKRIQSLGESRNSSRQMSFSQVENKRKILAIAITGVVLCLMGVVLYFGSNEVANHENTMEIAAQAPVAFEEPVLDLGESEPMAEETASEDEVLMPELDFTLEDEEEIAVVPETAPQEIVAPKVEKVEIAKVQNSVAPQNNGVKAENRTYGRKDNVLANLVKGNKVKVSRSCIMREGPASRFGLVKQIPSGAQIEVLTSTQEDWELQAGGVWTKAGETAKLGPGTQFADAPKGAKLPQPKSRVISASNWKYVKSGDLYGYVGPACFK